jgi:cyanoexosortase B-associated protein
MISLSKLLKEQQLRQVFVLLLLLVLLAVGAVPGYLKGHWQWQQPLAVKHLQKLQQIHKAGLNLPGWQTVEQSQQFIGVHKWSVQIIKKSDSSTQAMVLILPQTQSKDKPEVEWTDINSWGKSRWGEWNIAQSRPAEFTVQQSTSTGANTTAKVAANFFRASTPQQTFAVLQWYAMPDGGNPFPLHWFAIDQLAQWQQRRAAWVAVSILVPMEPLGNVETSWTLAKSVGETVQAALMAAI